MAVKRSCEDTKSSISTVVQIMVPSQKVYLIDMTDQIRQESYYIKVPANVLSMNQLMELNRNNGADLSYFVPQSEKTKELKTRSFEKLMKTDDDPSGIFRILIFLAIHRNNYVDKNVPFGETTVSCTVFKNKVIDNGSLINKNQEHLLHIFCFTW